VQDVHCTVHGAVKPTEEHRSDRTPHAGSRFCFAFDYLFMFFIVYLLLLGCRMDHTTVVFVFM